MKDTCWSIALLGATLWPVALQAAEPGPVAIEVDKAEIRFLAGKELVGVYHTGVGASRPHMKPVNAPGGIPVTIARPDGSHPHHRFLWFCHGQVVPEGIDLKGKKYLDFWMEQADGGKIVCTEVGAPRTKASHGQLATKNEWRMADGTRILDETRIIHLHDLGDAWLLVFDIDLHAAVVPITFGDTKEGSFGVRVNESMREAGGQGRIENAEGKVGEKDNWGQRSAWCDYSGAVNGKTIGVALLSDPSNPYPACWHVRAYGLMAANPFGRKSFPGGRDQLDLVRLAKGEHLKLRYGVLLHAGDAKAGKVADCFKQFTALGRD